MARAGSPPVRPMVRFRIAGSGFDTPNVSWPQIAANRERSLSASWLVRHDEERPEIEQAYEQMHIGGWQLQKLSATR